MRHPENQEEQSHCDYGKQQSLQAPEWCWCEERVQPPFEHPDSAEERGLDAGSAGCGLCNLEQRLAVGVGIAECGDDAIVAIELDRQVQPPQLPPEREVPGHQQDSERCKKKQMRIVRTAVLFLMAKHVPAFRCGQR